MEVVVGRGAAILRRFGFPPRHAEKRAALVLPPRGRRDEVRKILLRAFVRPVGFLWRNIGGKGLRFLGGDEDTVQIRRGSGFRSTRLRDRLLPRAERDLSSRHLPLALRGELPPCSLPVSIVVAQLLDHGLQYLWDLLLRLLLLQHVGQSGLQLGEAGRHGAHVALLRCLLLEDFEQGGVIRVEGGRGFDPGLGAGRRRAARFPVVQTLLHIVARVFGEFLVEEVVRLLLLEHLARQRLLGDGSDQSGAGGQLRRLGVRPVRRAPRLAESIGFQSPFFARRPADRIWQMERNAV